MTIDKTEDTSTNILNDKKMNLKDIENYLTHMVVNHKMTYADVSKNLSVNYATIRNILNQKVQYLTSRNQMQLEAGIRKFHALQIKITPKA